MSKQKIIQTIKDNSLSDSDKWFENLEPRKQEEVLLHDKLRDMDFRKKISKEDAKKFFSNTKMLDGQEESQDSLFTNNQKWFDNSYLLRNSISGLSDAYFNELISINSRGKTVLDIACGFGRESIIAAKSEAELVVGIDLSPNSVKEGNELAHKNNLNNVIFSVADCENLFFDDDTFDTIICARMLHHIEFETVMKELQRVLKKDGKVICIEALGINPLLNFYRKITPEQRTHWETANILTFKHIKIAQKYFKVEDIKYWHFLSPLAKFSKVLLPILNFLDSNFFSKIPLLNRLAWTFTFELKKENS
jgi:ubiquinone/menaquinone biosynthesis C-methylase UbiE